MSTMGKHFFSTIFFGLFLTIISGCGGGSSGTALGPPDGGGVKFAGVVVTDNGKEVSFAQITVLNTNDSTTTDEAGAFELESSFPGGDATLEVAAPNGDTATVEVKDVQAEPQGVELSIALDEGQDSAELLALTLRARIVRNCSPLFLNTRTIKQRSPLLEGTVCTIEAEFKSDGIPADKLQFQLQHRACSLDAPWIFSSVGITGTSGPGTGEIEFAFRNDDEHCVYRILGPVGIGGTTPISAQVHTLQKLAFDEENR